MKDIWWLEMPKTIQDLFEIGWERFTTDNNRVFYVRPGPDKRRVNQSLV